MHGKRIRELRVQKNMSQGQLAELVGVKAGYISVIELDRADISVNLLERLCEILGVTANVILEQKDLTPLPGGPSEFAALYETYSICDTRRRRMLLSKIGDSVKAIAATYADDPEMREKFFPVLIAL